MLDMKILRGESDTEEEQVQPKQNYFSQFFDNIGAWGKAAYANTRELGMGRDIKDVYDRIDKEQYGSREEYDRLVQELDTLQNERNEYRNMFDENQKILNQNDSAFKDFTEVGGTAQGIATQAKDTLIGAGVGALGGSVLPGVGTAAGASTGATWGNRIGAIHQAIQDADMNAIDAWERVLQEGGTSEQAEQAYQDAFRNNLPTEAMDIISSMYMGGKLTGAAGNILNRVLGKKMAGTVANAAGKVSRFDLPARAGTYVAAKTGSSVAGQALGVGLSMAENAAEEGIQEPWQDYATERAIDTQRRQYDPNHEGIRDFSVTGEGGLLDYYTTKQGKETALKAAKMGAVFGGVGGLLSHNQFTENGTAHSDSIKAGAQQAKWIEDNKILEDEGNKERYNEIKQTMGQVYDLTEDETENLSVEEVSRMYHEYYTNLYGVGGNRQEQSAVTQADFINAITGEESTRRDIMGEHAEKYINDFGINPGGETLRSMSQLQAEQAMQEGQVQEAIAETEEQNEEGQQEGIKAKSAKPGFFNNETKNSQEQTGEKKRGYWDLPDKFGKQWERIEEVEQFDYNEEAKFRNNITGRIANVKRVYDGKSGRGRPKYKYIVQDVTNENEQTQARLKFGKIGEFDSIQKVEKYLNNPYTNKETAFQSNGQVQEEATQALPQEDGVISDKGKGLTEDAQGNQYDNGKLIQSNKAVTIHTMGDLHQYYRDHKDLMSKDLYAEVSRQMMRFGIGKANNTEIVLDLTNRESGGFGSKTTTLDANGAIAKAVVRLYAGADLATAAHELAHLGWINLSQQDRDTFSKWAVATEGKFVAQVLGMQYDQNFRSALIEALTNKGQGGSQASQELWDKIRKEGAVSQTLDILNGTNTEAAIDERFAWEFSNWYAQGYIKGNNPRNIIERILQKACHTLRGALRLLYDTDRYLNKENYNGGEVNDIFSRMSPTRKDTGVRQVQGQPQVELRTEMTQPIQEMAYNPNQGFNETYGETLDTNPNQNISRNTGTIGAQVKPVTPIKTNPNQNINKNTGTVATNKKRNGGNKQSQTYDQSTSKSVTQYKEPPYNGTRELSTQGRVILNNTTAEKLASKIMERYKNAPNMVGAAIQNVFSHVRNEQDQAFAESVLDNVLKQMNSYYGQAVYYDNGVFYGSSSQEEQSQVDNEPIPAEGQKQKNRRKRKNKETTTSTTPVQVAEVVEDETQEQTNQPERTSPEVDNQPTQETTQEQPVGNTTEETPTQQQEQQEQTDNAQTQQEEQTEQIEEPIRGKGVSKGALKTGLSRIKNHKFKTDTRAVYYKELLELEEEIFGKVGALSKRQFEDLRWFALDEKDKQFDEAHPELKYPDENIDSKQEEQNKSVENQNLTTDNQNATMVGTEEQTEVTDNGEAEDTRGTENLRTDVGEVQGGGSVRQGNDNRTGEGRNRQNAVEGRSEGDGKNLSLLKDKQIYSTYNQRKEKKTELKDWRNMSGDDKLKQVFVDALNASKEADVQHGVYVDGKTVEELKDCKVVLHKNKMAGFAVTKDGNIVAVFSNPNNPIRGILNDMIFIAHMMGGNRMDCFGKFLLRGYRNCGFTPVARTSFAEEYYPADNPANATIRKEKPDVYFLVKDNDNNNTYLNKVENDVYMNDAIDADSVYHIDSEDSYSDALDFQGKVLKEIRKKSNANKSTMEIAESLRPVESPTVAENETVENAETTEITKTQDSESENITETQNVESQTESQETTEEQVSVESELEKRDKQEKEYYDKKEFEYNRQKYKYNPTEYEYYKIENGNNVVIKDESLEGLIIDAMRKMDSPFYKKKPTLSDSIKDLEAKIFYANNRLKNTTKEELKKDTELKELQGELKDLQNKRKSLQKTIDALKDSADTDSLEKTMKEIEYDIKVTEGEIYRFINDINEMREDAKQVKQNAPKAIKILNNLYGEKQPPKKKFSSIKNQAVKRFNKDYIARENALKNPDLSFARAYYDLVTTLENGEGDWEHLPLNQEGELSESNTKKEINKALTILNYGAENGNPECNYYLAELATGEEDPNLGTFDSVKDIIEERFEFTDEQIVDMYKTASDGGIAVAKRKLSTETLFQEKGENNNENTTRGKEEERVRQQTVQEQGRDREVNKKDTGLNGQRGLSRSVQQDDSVLSKTGNNNSGQNNRTDTKFQEAGRNAENQTLLTEEKEKELEDLFWKLIRKKQFHGMDSRWGSGVLDYYKNLSKSTKRHDLNPEYIQGNKGYLTAIKNINDYIHNKYPQYKNVYRGVDGHWRFEFSDKDASFINGFEKLSGKELKTTLGKILRHDNLYKFYPELKNTPVHLVRNAEMQKFMDAEDITEKEYFAAYDPESQSIYINSDMLTDGDARNSLLHEIQHAVQDIEGFANGSYSNAYNNDYNYSEGEKQAVLTEKRSNMSEEEIQNNPRYQTLNTEEKTIIEGQNQEYKPVTDTKMQSNGQTSSNFGYIDKQKDIYSVTFTKSAQKNGENQKKIQFYRNNKSYWRENTNQDGSITFTRALPYQQHQKTITYDDINGKTVGKRKKSKVREYYEAVKDQIIKWLFNDKHFLMKAAQHVGALESYMRMMVMKDQGAVAGAAIEDGIVKHNSKTGERTKSLNSIIEAVGEDNQTEFLNYCEAFRILDLAKRGIKQKMTTQEANKIIADVKKSKNAKLFEDQRKNFVEYNHELLWVLVDGGFITEEQYDKFLKVDPNFIPLSKNMEELEGFVDGFKDSKTMINIPIPIHKIGTSMREVKNPFLEMQKRTVEYYVKASRNKAGLIFVNDIANAIAQDAQGDVVAQNQGMVRKLASRDKNGNPISHDSKQNVFYVWNNGEKEYYQVADREIYIALRSFDADQMGALKKIANATFGFSSRLVRDTATMTPDFGLRNLCRDNLEAFISSEHGFLPFVDSFWGMYQMANDTQWFKEYQSMNGELGTRNRDGENVATVEHDIKDNVKFWKTYFPLIKKDFRELTDTKRSKAARAKSLLLLATDVTGLHSIFKMNKRMNDYLEIGTRIGEYRNARMGYKGLSGRLFGNNSNVIFTNDNDLKRASTSQMYAAYKSKDITLNFGQHGILGKELNRYIPFFNASLQGIYKVGNTLDNMIHGKDARTKQELRFKFLLMAAIGMSAALAGTGDDDYDEAPDYEHDNFWILPNGVRIPKDQLFGRLVGGTIEKATHQYLKDGDVKELELVQDVLGNFAIDKCTPALIDLGFGIVGNYDTFKGRSVTPEYMAEKLGYLQKDLSTSKLGADISEAMFKVFGVDIGAKKVDFVFSKTLSNLGKYVQSLYELTGHNEKMTRGAEPEDKGGFAETSKELPYPLNSIVGTFATNRNTFQSISDFYDRHKELKKLSSDESIMSKDEKKAWDAYQKAYKEDKKYRDALKAIKLDKSLTGAQKRQKADKIFKQQIKMARKLKDWEKKHGLA